VAAPYSKSSAVALKWLVCPHHGQSEEMFVGSSRHERAIGVSQLAVRDKTLRRMAESLCAFFSLLGAKERKNEPPGAEKCLLLSAIVSKTSLVSRW
jgi:hypothetical protein